MRDNMSYTEHVQLHSRLATIPFAKTIMEDDLMQFFTGSGVFIRLFGLLGERRAELFPTGLSYCDGGPCLVARRGQSFGHSRLAFVYGLSASKHAGGWDAGPVYRAWYRQVQVQDMYYRTPKP